MLLSHESSSAQRTVWHIWISIEKFSPDWRDSHVVESHGVTASIRGIRWCIMNTSMSPDSSDLFVFLCSCLHFLSHCDSLPPPPHFIIIPALFPHPSLTLWLSCLFMLYSSLFFSSGLPCRSTSHPSVPYHYYEPSGPDECSMYLSHERSRRGSHHRFITEKTVFANWAQTLNIHFYQPDWKPAAVVTSTNSSCSPVPAGSWDSLQRRSPEV